MLIWNTNNFINFKTTLRSDPKKSLIVKQVEFVIVVRRTKILGIAITVGIIVIYLAGLFVADSNFIENFEFVNLISLLQLLLTIPLSFYVKKIILDKTDLSNFTTKYFNAHVIPFMMLDFGALFCITTNLFVNGNILYASIGVLISVISMVMILPKEEDFEKIRSSFTES